MSIIFALIVIAFLLFFFEIFVPGGFLAICGVLLLLIASALAVPEFGWLWAGAIFCGGILAGCALFFIEVRLIEKTPWGRQFALKEVVEGQSNVTNTINLEGKQGVTLTTLAPSGTVRLDDKTYTAATRGEYLAQGTPVRVVRSTPFHLIVEKS